MPESISSIDERMRSCPGWQFFLVFRRIKAAYYVFRRNYRELAAALSVYSQPGITLDRLQIGGDMAIDRHVMELNRLILNYLAASEALREHTNYQVITLYSGQPFKAEFFHETKVSFSPDLRSFMRGLRHYTLHHKLPLSITQFIVQQDHTLRGQVLLSVCALRECESYWKKSGKAYLDSLSDEIQIAEVLAQHKNAIGSMYDWLATRQKELHREELAELEHLQRQLRSEGRLIRKELGKTEGNTRIATSTVDQAAGEEELAN